MIHQHKTPDGKTTFRAYSLRDLGDGDGGHQYTFLAAFDTIEAAKDSLLADLAAQMARFRHRLTVLHLAIGSDSADESDDAEDALAQVSSEVQNDMYFLLRHAQELFAPCETRDDGITDLHGDAAIEYAARHGLKVKYAELERGDFKAGYPELLTPGQAKERMPQTRERWIWIEAPDDTVTDDLPENIWPTSLPFASSVVERTPEMLRESARDWRAMADKWEREAEAMEAQP
jgi:hypothetical protein